MYLDSNFPKWEITDTLDPEKHLEFPIIHQRRVYPLYGPLLHESFTCFNFSHLLLILISRCLLRCFDHYVTNNKARTDVDILNMSRTHTIVYIIWQKNPRRPSMSIRVYNSSVWWFSWSFHGLHLFSLQSNTVADWRRRNVSFFPRPTVNFI